MYTSPLYGTMCIMIHIYILYIKYSDYNLAFSLIYLCVYVNIYIHKHTFYSVLYACQALDEGFIYILSQSLGISITVLGYDNVMLSDDTDI